MTPRRAARTSAIRHCPLCGVAMQASKSREDLKNFDTFRCLTCHTTIVEAAPDERRDGPPVRRTQAK